MKTNMKTLKYIFLSVLAGWSLFACTDEWNSHYEDREVIVENENIIVVNQSAIDYLESQTHLSKVYELFLKTGVLNQLKEKNSLVTILVTDNNSPDVAMDDLTYLASSHFSDVSLSPSNLYDGQRILMWNKKYLNVSKVVDSTTETTIGFNNALVKKIIKVTDGYIYELDNYVDSPRSMYETLTNLSDEYSIFREAVMSRNQLFFDKEASIPIGVDQTGSTVYDSVFVVTNPYFSAKGFDLMSESLNATMLIPSNELITKAIDKAHADLSVWNMERQDSILNNWMFQSAFFDTKLSKQDFEENIDLTSIFGKQWRTTVQKVDLNKPVSLSNGVAYYIRELKLPTNVLIYRVKDYMKWYEFLSDVEKEEYFASEDLAFHKLETRVTEWSGWPEAGFPNIINRTLSYKLVDNEALEYTLNFKGFRYDEKTREASLYKIPPGEYDLCLGFEQTMRHDIEVSFNNEVVGSITTSQFTTTTFHYDRGGQGYPEFYDTSKATSNRKNNYDRDGGKVGTVVIDGTEPIEMNITFRGFKLNNPKICFHHWCLKPTKNCY